MPVGRHVALGQSIPVVVTQVDPRIDTIRLSEAPLYLLEPRDVDIRGDAPTEASEVKGDVGDMKEDVPGLEEEVHEQQQVPL